MFARESMLGMRTESNPNGLVHAIRFADGDYFPDDAKNIQQDDLRKFNIPLPVFEESAKYIDFVERMQTVCAEISKKIMSCPEWSADWPVVTPQPTGGAEIPLPRLT